MVGGERAAQDLPSKVGGQQMRQLVRVTTGHRASDDHGGSAVRCARAERRSTRSRSFMPQSAPLRHKRRPDRARQMHSGGSCGLLHRPQRGTCLRVPRHDALHVRRHLDDARQNVHPTKSLTRSTGMFPRANVPTARYTFGNRGDLDEVESGIRRGGRRVGGCIVFCVVQQCREFEGGDAHDRGGGHRHDKRLEELHRERPGECARRLEHGDPRGLDHVDHERARRAGRGVERRDQRVLRSRQLQGRHLRPQVEAHEQARRHRGNNANEATALLAQDNVYAAFIATDGFSGAKQLAAAGIPTFGWNINAEWAGPKNFFPNVAPICFRVARWSRTSSRRW